VTPQGISPRKSFAAWKEQVRGRSRPWTPRERALGEALRYATLEIVLRHADQIDRERRKSVEQQDLLIAELNHRVRNILSLVRALLQQSSDDQRSVTEFVSSLGSRVDALARAHDLLTRDLWGPGSVRDLITDEFHAYVGSKVDRIEIRGDDIGLRPDALSTVAMVLHELTTNAAKYGALCDRRGRVVLTLTVLPSGELDMHWEEIGGPAVKPPQRAGFGSTVIERAVPFTLGGTATVQFLVAGLQARLRIPARHVVSLAEVTRARREIAPTEPAPDRPLSGSVLLVEDNMLIAMNAETYLRELGADHVEIASNVDRAFSLIERVTPNAVFLDVNLGDETSFGLADHLVERAVPFAFMSGYADGPAIPKRFGDVPKVSKPYKIDDIRRAARSLASAS
jgi:two-component sensor histidine kinase/CheY-like chemotaxis protein